MTTVPGLVETGHQVLFKSGSLRLILETPTVKVKGLISLPEAEANEGPEARPEVIQFMFAVTATSMFTVITEPELKLYIWLPEVHKLESS